MGGRERKEKKNRFYLYKNIIRERDRKVYYHCSLLSSVIGCC